jgi:hypothetical protein
MHTKIALKKAVVKIYETEKIFELFCEAGFFLNK